MSEAYAWLCEGCGRLVAKRDVFVGKDEIVHLRSDGTFCGEVVKAEITDQACADPQSEA